MQPYRSASLATENPSVAFGGSARRWLWLAAALGLITLSIAILVAWAHSGGRIGGSVLLPALFGLALLSKRLSGTLTLDRRAREVVVTMGRVAWRRSVRVPVEEIMGLTVGPRSFKDPEPTYELRLLLPNNRALVLLDGKSDASVEQARATVSAFLVEHELPRRMGA